MRKVSGLTIATTTVARLKATGGTHHLSSTTNVIFPTSFSWALIGFGDLFSVMNQTLISSGSMFLSTLSFTECS